MTDLNIIDLANEEIDRLQKIVDEAELARLRLPVLRRFLDDWQTAMTAATYVPKDPPCIVTVPQGSKLAEVFGLDPVPEPQASPQKPAEEPVPEPAKAKPETPVAVSERAPKKAIEVPVDAATLEPVTARQAQVFAAMLKLQEAKEEITAKAVSTETGLRNPNDCLHVLIMKGYAKRQVGGYPIKFRPIATGIPRVSEPPEPSKSVEVLGDPEVDRSAFAKAQAIKELDPVGYLVGKGHTVTRITSDCYKLDGNVVPLKAILERVNVHRTKGKLPPLDLERYL